MILSMYDRTAPNMRRSDLSHFLSFTFLVIILFAFGAYAQPVTQPIQTQTPQQKTDTVKQERKIARSAIKELQNDIDGLLKSRDFTDSHIGVSVMSADNGEVIYKESDTKNFIPASTQKLYTTAAALDFLGKDFRYSTRLYLDGKTNANGEFVGNVILRGSGDPTWSSYFNTDPLSIFDSWMMKFDSLGIKSIKGNIIGDDTYFDSEHYGPGWSWDDMPYPYSAQVGALSANDNKVDIIIYPGSIAGEPARVVIKDDNKYVRIVNSIITSNIGEATDISVDREPATNIVELHGRISLEGKAGAEPFKISVTVDNPTLYVLHLLKQSLEAHQIKVRGALLDGGNWSERINYTQLKPVCEYLSTTLSNIVAVVNKTSHNLCAESLLKTLGKETSGTGSFANGVENVKSFLTKSGIQHENFYMVDGSGLSRLNLCSPNNLSQLLWSMRKGENKEVFETSLAVPGEQGTMRTRTVGTLAEKKLRAKTGSMNSVCTLAGYVTTRDGETLCFAIMINNFSAPENLARNLQDLICMRLASFSRKG